MELLTNINVDFISKRRIGFVLSAIVILIGIASLVANRGPDLGIDFRGGVQVQVKFEQPVSISDLRQQLAALDFADATVTQSGEREGDMSTEVFISVLNVVPESVLVAQAPGDADAITIAVTSQAVKTQAFREQDSIVIEEALADGGTRARTRTIVSIDSSSDPVVLTLDRALEEAFSSAATVRHSNVGRHIENGFHDASMPWTVVSGGVNISEVGPSIGQDLQKAAVYSIFFAILFLLAYISWRFELRFAVGAIAALVHDILVTLGAFSLLSREINLATVAAFLTIIGYSLNDTIVVYDRIRENSKLLRGTNYKDIINRSINQSLTRTIITSLTTLAVVVVIFLLAGPGELNNFALALIMGVIVGTYSSIFIASPILHGWHLRLQRQQR